MKKIFTIILVFSLLSFIFLTSCIIENPSDTQTTSGTDYQEDKKTSTTEISFINENKSENVYTQIELGRYLGERIPVLPEKPLYKIIKTYEEAVSLTSNSEILRKELFEDYYILAILRQGYGYKTKIACFKDLSYFNGQLFITEVIKSQSNSHGNYVDNAYILVPKNLLEDVEDEYYINITRLEYEYLKTRQLQINASTSIKDGQMFLIESAQLEGWLKENNVNTTIEFFNTADNSHFLACYSQNSFDNQLSYRYLNIENEKISITRDYSINENKGVRAFLDIIPVPSSYNLDNIKTVELISYGLNNTIPMRQTQIQTVDVIKDSIEYYPHFDGHQYLGIELTDEKNYIIIYSYEELKENVRNYNIDKSLFDDNCVLIIRDMKYYFTGYYDLNSTDITIKADVGYERFVYDKKEELIEEIDKIEMLDNYNYLIVPKSRIGGMSKTGKLTIQTELISDSSSKMMCFKKTDLSHIGINEGDSWLLTTKLEIEEFNELYNISLEDYYDWLVIYANEARDSLYSYAGFEIINNEAKINIYRNVSVINENHIEPMLICFAVNTGNQYIENSISLLICITDLSGIKYYADEETSFEKHQTFTADINACTKGKTKLLKRPDFDSKIITKYEDLTSLFEEYIDKNISEVFEESIFNENYVIAVYKCMECYSTYSEYFDIHIGAGSVNVYYKYDGLDSGVSHDTLFLIAVPRDDGLLGEKKINLIRVYLIKDANEDT